MKEGKYNGSEEFPVCPGWAKGLLTGILPSQVFSADQETYKKARNWKKKKKRIRWGHVTDHETALGMEQWGVFLSRSSQKLVSEK